MKTRLLSARGGLVLLGLLACAGRGVAYADDADPPGRVARLSDAEGSVSLQPAGVQEWTAATLNRPITTGDKLWSDRNSRAELDIGAAVIRVGSSTGFSLLNLDDHTAQIQITAGTLIVRVRDLQSGDNYEIDTPNVALSLQEPGEYRVEVNDRGDATLVKVSEGAAAAAAGGQTIAITAQQMVRFTGTDTLAYDSATLGAPDDLDNWSSARERQVEDSASAEYVASDVPGTQDLDQYGQWQATPEYGYVWTPTTVAVGWVPYRFGHWVWISPWGWTWVDDAPWGYAPFHYGRWVQWSNNWCWVPGPRRVRPLYAPALVAWVGGPGVGVSVGWFPLGPREVYMPGYGASAAYVRQVNITNTTIVNNTYITNVYQNNVTPTHYAHNRAAAVTAVPQNVFTSGQRVGAHAVQLSGAALAGAAVTAAAPAIAPIRQSVLGPAEGRGVVRPPPALLNRTVVARTSPPRAPAPFEKQLAALQANGGRPLGRAQIAQLQPATPAARVNVIKATGPVVAAGALPQRAGSMRPASPPSQAPAGAGAKPELAERERILQNSRLTPAPHPSTAVSPPPANASTTLSQPPTHATTAVSPAPSHLPTYAPPPAPEWRTDRPPSVQQNLPPTQQRAFTSDDPTHAYGKPPSIPVYHPPSATNASGRTPESPRPDESRPQDSYRAAPRVMVAPPPPPPPPVHPQAPAHQQSSKEPRDSAPHADRESRERGAR